ncbi:short-chain dehydrogenase, partial [Streptomyces sp. TRM76130]|nr:short-chain dehydrogenase [Streptomyces sp. TRM76130]
RGYLPGVIATVGRREMRRFGDRLSGVGKGLVGAGGVADEQQRVTARD